MLTAGNIASGGLRAISYQGTREVKAGYNPSHTHIPRHLLYCVLANVISLDLYSFILNESFTLLKIELYKATLIYSIRLLTINMDKIRVISINGNKAIL